MPLKFSTEGADEVVLIASARQALGRQYGLARPLRKGELARLAGVNAEYLARAEKGRVAIGGPIRVVLGMLMAGHRSPWHAEALASRSGRAG